MKKKCVWWTSAALRYWHCRDEMGERRRSAASSALSESKAFRGQSHRQQHIKSYLSIHFKVRRFKYPSSKLRRLLEEWRLLHISPCVFLKKNPTSVFSTCRSIQYSNADLSELPVFLPPTNQLRRTMTLQNVSRVESKLE